eukprot:15468217-Alexandrium_andersonii.AAC.1
MLLPLALAHAWPLLAKHEHAIAGCFAQLCNPCYAHIRARAIGLAVFRRADGQISCKVGSDRATL